MKKYFVVTDIHGHYTIMKTSLANAGFDASNPDHVIICLGDYFDRGDENYKVFDFFRSLPNKILIKGNHDDRMLQLLNGGRLNDVDILNGSTKTVAQLFDHYYPRDGAEIDFRKYKVLRTEMIEFFQGMSDYYETPKMVFTHAWLPVEFDFSGFRRISENWRNADATEWQKARWLDWATLYFIDKAVLKDKTIVCGHHPALFAKRFDNTDQTPMGAPYYGKGVIAMDATVYSSGILNVLVFDEDQL